MSSVWRVLGERSGRKRDDDDDGGGVLEGGKEEEERLNGGKESQLERRVKSDRNVLKRRSA